MRDSVASGISTRTGGEYFAGDRHVDPIEGLLALKKRIDAAKIPLSNLDEIINVAVWNIREFGRKRRTEPAIHFIAEILGQFDLVT